MFRKMCFVNRASRNPPNPFARWAHYTCPFRDPLMADLAAPESTPHRPRKGGRKAGPLAENNRVTVYYQGKLVYGTEPTAATTATTQLAGLSAGAATMQVAVGSVP